MTSILNIHIDGITKDGKIFNNIEFEPNMLSDKYSNYDYTLFSPILPITKKSLPNNNKIESFFSLELFKNIIQKIKEERNIQNIGTNFNNTNIINNIEFVLNLLFSYGNHFTINNTIYTIYNYTWDGKYNIDKSKRDITIFDIHIRLILYQGKNIPFYDSLILSCNERKREAKRNLYELSGSPQYQLDKSVDYVSNTPIKENPDILKKTKGINNIDVNAQFAGNKKYKTKNKRKNKTKNKIRNKSKNKTKKNIK
tara:strand:+ start:3770 stop:4531 length:762 start_codon:yes stop_codon:yes gene_type:complete